MTTPMILTAQVPNHRQDHWGHHFISSPEQLDKRSGYNCCSFWNWNLLSRFFGSKNYLSILPIVVTNWAICTACKFQECFRMIHVATPETDFWRGRTTTYILVGQRLSRQAATATTQCIFPRALLGSSTASKLLKIIIWKLFLPLCAFLPKKPDSINSQTKKDQQQSGLASSHEPL